MKLCIHCDSDMIEKKNYLEFKLPIAMLLLIFPNGVFFCWVPFLIPGNYVCKKCYKSSKKVKEIDWREHELLEKIKTQQTTK
ncbi:hypothetical protein V1503_07410 [Bacillus sp. SCS-151]|uniref:hypothetical protein n=1 Tax=Nanhaiella sioensis TaxID=3115293 RepID=UPI00397CCDFD